MNNKAYGKRVFGIVEIILVLVACLGFGGCASTANKMMAAVTADDSGDSSTETVKIDDIVADFYTSPVAGMEITIMEALDDQLRTDLQILAGKSKVFRHGGTWSVVTTGSESRYAKRKDTIQAILIPYTLAVGGPKGALAVRSLEDPEILEMSLAQIKAIYTYLLSTKGWKFWGKDGLFVQEGIDPVVIKGLQNVFLRRMAAAEKLMTSGDPEKFVQGTQKMAGMIQYILIRACMEKLSGDATTARATSTTVKAMLENYRMKNPETEKGYLESSQEILGKTQEWVDLGNYVKDLGDGIKDLGCRFGIGKCE